jgi:hypothetical protein
VIATFRSIRLSDVIAGLVNSCLLFTFAAVFSSAIFGDVGLSQYVALGTGCNLITSGFISCVYFSFLYLCVSIVYLIVCLWLGTPVRNPWMLEATYLTLVYFVVFIKVGLAECLGMPHTPNSVPRLRFFKL